MIDLLSYGCLGIGLVFWFWGTAVLPTRKSLLFKLHNLSVSDTLGSMSIIVGLLLRRSQEWPLLLLAIFSLALWNTMLGYVMAYCVSRQSPPDELDAPIPDAPMLEEET